MVKSIGVLTAGGDAPGLNAAIRAIGKSAIRKHGLSVVGYLDGFRGLMDRRHVRLDSDALSGILIKGGTILGTSRDKPHKMRVGDQTLDMTAAMVETAANMGVEAIVCLGGGGTQKNAKRLADAGMNVVTLPKTIDNDVWGTERTFGFDTALSIATEAIDRLHSTAHSHHRTMVVEVMGHNTGWLALGAGLAGGADVILIPEIPYSLEKVADTLMARKSSGSRFSIVAISEGAVSTEEKAELDRLLAAKADATNGDEKAAAKQAIAAYEHQLTQSTATLAEKLEGLTGIASRTTILGHVQRGGSPSAVDRLLATYMGADAVQAIVEGDFGKMIATSGRHIVRLPLEEVAGRRRTVPLDHKWIEAARTLGVGFGD
ncbi:6-phosphofructokinase [Euzebya rosea]|uniref:6-phosphofructokinase n=1 Tax=Euzebya rosea TaxID=2052804 RepID=UPI000D3E52D1|nr:ATP-dependent 6-phosphofructokinase [Euzebya rosea]